MNKEELSRYARHLSLPEIGEAGQEKIKQAKVLCIGAGGLGSAALCYLTAAGVGTIGIVDDDCVEVSNLQRQIIHANANVGQPKVLSAKAWIKQHNPAVHVDCYQERLTHKNAAALIARYDVIIDGTDNFESHYLINDACFFIQKPLIHASVHRFDGQLSVFCQDNGPCYRCLYPTAESLDSPNCSEAGVLGVLPGLLGILQATECLKLIAGFGESMAHRLLLFNALTMQFKTIALLNDPACALCGINPTIKGLQMNHEITVTQLQSLMKQHPQLTLVDVREPHELLTLTPIENAINIPLQTLPAHLDKLPTKEKFVVYCRSGMRSHQAVQYLTNLGFDCDNLIGGIEAWHSHFS